MQPAALLIKEKLHQIIECIDDEKILEAFYAILGVTEMKQKIRSYRMNN